MRIYLTHCSAKKDFSCRDSGQITTPEHLYTAKPLQRFVARCKTERVDWAIFSDLYGVWFPDIQHTWYEKDPNSVTPSEFDVLLSDFDAKLAPYDEIWFYQNPGRFHSLYRRLLQSSSLRERIRLFSRKSEILRVEAANSF